MKEGDVVLQSNQPNTLLSLYEEFGKLNLRGETVLVHSSLSSLGWVCGGPQSVVMALMESIGRKFRISFFVHH